MALIRWRDRGWPFRELDELREEMDRLFDRTFGRAVPARHEGRIVRGWMPTIDMFEREDEVVVRAEIPGMSKEEIDISTLGNTLTISGERKAEAEVKEDNYYCCERSYGRFQREITLPQGVDAEKIKASYKNGILEVTLPKKEETKPKKIEVAIE
ncbi:Hsp20/alpha crystallin family protein [Candidatus Poribacteria bacterium]|nr:Hsp20/alpha crystallin family protein [Candidatus Poribacteria bacterium]